MEQRKSFPLAGKKATLAGCLLREKFSRAGSTYSRLFDANSNTLPPTKFTLTECLASPHLQLRTPITSSQLVGVPISLVTSS